MWVYPSSPPDLLTGLERVGHDTRESCGIAEVARSVPLSRNGDVGGVKVSVSRMRSILLDAEGLNDSIETAPISRS